jgi:outer membrane protein assembly factor BamB
MNGISREKGLVSTWSPDGENLIWKKTELGTRSTPIVMRGKLYSLCRHNPETTSEGEKVVCVDAVTGDPIWENVFNVFLTDAPAERVGWSCVAGDPRTGNVYALGLCDYFQCLDGETGKTLWSHSMSEEYGMISTYGGRTNMPLLFDDLVIISGVMTGWGEYAVPAHRFVAFDKTNGQAVWLSSTRLRPLDTTYSSPVLAPATVRSMPCSPALAGSSGTMMHRSAASTRPPPSQAIPFFAVTLKKTFSTRPSWGRSSQSTEREPETSPSRKSSGSRRRA